jgi:SAM-dependent methyltransferase
VTGPSTGNHYGYSVYADPATASTFDESRFGGPIGGLIASTQAAVLREFIGPIAGRRVLDVGTGTGRAALLIAREGGDVKAVDPSDAMLSVARKRAAERGLSITFGLGDAHALEFPDRMFDVVVSLRVLMHTPRWRTCLSELCRVTNGLIVLDYPAVSSAASVQSIARRALHAVGLSKEPYRVFSDRQITDVLARAGFQVRSRHRQFVLPIALHKMIGSPRFTQQSEALLERIGLLKLAGSPVTIVAERCAY